MRRPQDQPAQASTGSRTADPNIQSDCYFPMPPVPVGAAFTRRVLQCPSNKAIGKKLSMATRTASPPLSNIFQKLDVGSRGELDGLIREKGLLED